MNERDASDDAEYLPPPPPAEDTEEIGGTAGDWRIEGDWTNAANDLGSRDAATAVFASDAGRATVTVLQFPTDDAAAAGGPRHPRQDRRPDIHGTGVRRRVGHAIRLRRRDRQPRRVASRRPVEAAQPRASVHRRSADERRGQLRRASRLSAVSGAPALGEAHPACRPASTEVSRARAAPATSPGRRRPPAPRGEGRRGRPPTVRARHGSRPS